MSSLESPFTPGWKAGAKALAEFQKDHNGVAKGGEVTGGPREGSKYATLLDILRVCSQGAAHGLSHAGQARLLGEGLLVWREVLHHDSGESIYTEHPIPVPTKGLPGQIQQDIGGAITYARKYCLQALYGLYADDGMDPDSISYGDAASSKAAKAEVRQRHLSQEPVKAPIDKAAESIAQNFSGQVTVTEAEPNLERPLTAAEKDRALAIFKNVDHGKEWKDKFKAKFYPNAEKLTAGMVSSLKHLAYLDELELATAPF